MQSDHLTIGQVAANAGVNVETIRYYQRQALMDLPTRPPGGIRRYDNRHVRRLRFIKRAQELGFKLEEVRGLLQLDDGKSCREARSLAEAKLVDIGEKLGDLRTMQRHLNALVAQCQLAGGDVGCPLIDSLSGARLKGQPASLALLPSARARSRRVNR